MLPCHLANLLATISEDASRTDMDLISRRIRFRLRTITKMARQSVREDIISAGVLTGSATRLA